MKENPDRIAPLDKRLMNRIGELVKGINVDPNESLGDDVPI
jgi:hypothetical protein